MECHYHIRLYNPLASHHASEYIEWKTSLASLKAIRHEDVALDKMGYDGFLWSFLRSGKVQCNSDVCLSFTEAVLLVEMSLYPPVFLNLLRWTNHCQY